ncbi:MAG: hypothetical protein ABI383_12455 [Acidobacteriaceae bacterium]
MKQRGFTIPEIILIGGTRAALGAGVALLVSGKISRDARNAAGWVLLAVGALTTIPIALGIHCKPDIAKLNSAERT